MEFDFFSPNFTSSWPFHLMHCYNNAITYLLIVYYVHDIIIFDNKIVLLMLSQANIGTINERNWWQIPKILKQAVPEIWHLNTGQNI